MKYRHVQQRNGKFVWRLNVLGHALNNLDGAGREITYAHPARAAFECDLVKHFLRLHYLLCTTKTELSHEQAVFEQRAADAGIDFNDAACVFEAMPSSAQECCTDLAEELTAHKEKALAEAATSGSSDYFVTLIASSSARLNDCLTVLRKAKQMSKLSDERRVALVAIETAVEQFETAHRASVAALIEIP